MRKNFLKTDSQENILLLLHTTKKSKKTVYNKRLATKIVADWELKVVVPGTEPVRIAFDWRE